MFAQILADLGYRPVTTVLSVPVTFESMRNGDIDVFLGNWMPAQSLMLAPYAAAGDVVKVRDNLVGAKYTLAVPDYLHEQGLRDFADIQRFRKELGASIYGIEPGNDGNAHVLELIKKNEFGLGGFKLVESSEQGMLAQVERAYRAREAVVFLAWAPHPMNTHFDVRYLTGGDASFGPDFGAATGQHRRASRLPRAVPERRPPAAEPRVRRRHRERVDGPHPERQGARVRSRAANGWRSGRRSSSAGWPGCRPSTGDRRSRRRTAPTVRLAHLSDVRRPG